MKLSALFLAVLICTFVTPSVCQGNWITPSHDHYHQEFEESHGTSAHHDSIDSDFSEAQAAHSHTHRHSPGEPEHSHSHDHRGQTSPDLKMAPPHLADHPHIASPESSLHLVHRDRHFGQHFVECLFRPPIQV